MIKIDRPKRPNISIYTTKNTNLDRNQDKDNALRETLKLLIDANVEHFKDIFERLENGKKFTKAEAETLKAIAFFADTNNFNNDKKLTKKTNLKFSVYKNAKLKENLKIVFNDKCAYCESKLAHVTPPDIEHFRPKAAINPFTNQIDEDLIYPGYYWLGADWDNLLWSCPLCNRKTKQLIPDAVELEPLGKKNRFPVIANRVRSHHELISKEELERLLIDPCKENPADHLEFQLDGTVRSKIDNQGNPNAMGEASKKAYALNRQDLVMARRKECKRLKVDLIGIRNTLKLIIRENDPAKKRKHKEEFNIMREAINDEFAVDSPFLAQKEVIISDFFEREGIASIGFTKEGLLD
ncbi:hypothetical protein [Jejuia spongiicola]|uniref:HNH nuclease domain-containing protein n=1 Tax=Jejuia spongiicola TaxID=2942207 RepID=A0ABT0QD53_9FLAO|nr:hypothetical protein [Jejuia spongiicola]MCL6294868.1 hypothetical protein [Jejuia spongiicola]